VLARARAGELPTLRALARAGAATSRVEGVAPASGHPTHATLLTGVRPAEHGVVADRRLGERGVRRALYAHASHLQRATLWQRVAEAGGTVAALDWPSTRGAAIARLLPDAASVRGSWLEQLGDAATPSLRDFVTAHGGADPDAAAPGPARDAALLALACDLLASGSPPRLLLVRLGGSAPALEGAGPGSPEAARAFEALDAALGDWLDCLAGAERLASLTLALVGDHGRAAVHTEIAANRVLAEAGLLTPSADGIESWRAVARSNGASAFVYARDEEAALAARRAFAGAAERTRAFRVVSAEEMIRGGADPEAWFGLQAQPGYAFGDALRSQLLGASPWRGVGGDLPERPEMDAALVLWGRGVREGLVVPQMAQVDVAPTLALLLGVELDAPVGRGLVGLLSIAPAAASGAPGTPP
jgi:hypothetical protein